MDLERLQQLQDIDIKCDQALRNLQAVAKQLSEPPFLAQMDAEIAAQDDVTRLADQAAREASAQLQLAERRIRATDQRIASGSISDYRILEQLQRDRYAQTQQLTLLNEAKTRTASEARSAQDASDWLQQLRAGALNAWNARQAGIETERQSLQEHVDEFSRQIELERARISDADLTIYDQYRRRRPRVVTRVVGGVCEECRLMVPTISLTRARRGDRLVECPSCGCILRVT